MEEGNGDRSDAKLMGEHMHIRMNQDQKTPPRRSQAAAREGVARLAAERALLRRHRGEYRSLAEEHGHVEATRKLVQTCKAEYDEYVKVARAREGQQAQAAAEAA